MENGQRGPPPAESTIIPAAPNLLWDQIENKYWETARICLCIWRCIWRCSACGEDSSLDDNFKTQMDKLQSQHVSRHEERLQILKKIQELQARIEELKWEDVNGEASG